MNYQGAVLVFHSPITATMSNLPIYSTSVAGERRSNDMSRNFETKVVSKKHELYSWKNLPIQTRNSRQNTSMKKLKEGSSISIQPNIIFSSFRENSKVDMTGDTDLRMISSPFHPPCSVRYLEIFNRSKFTCPSTIS